MDQGVNGLRGEDTERRSRHREIETDNQQDRERQRERERKREMEDKVKGLLSGAGLGQYWDLFNELGIDSTSFPLLTLQDLYR